MNSTTDLKSNLNYIMLINLFSSKATLISTGEKITYLGNCNDDRFSALVRQEPGLAARMNNLTGDILRALVQKNQGNLMLVHDGIFPLSVMREVVGTPKAFMLSGNPLVIDEKVAELIAARPGCTWFQGIEKMPIQVAEILGRSTGRLHFETPMALQIEAAMALVQCKGLLCLCLKELTPSLAGVFSQAAGPLYLDLTRPLALTSAKKLARHQYTLTLQQRFKPQPITPSIAQELVRHQGKALNLLNLPSLSTEVAEILIHYQGCLGFGILNPLSTAVADILSQYKGELRFFDTKINAAAMRHLARFQGDLELQEVPLTDPLCEILAGHRGKLVITIKKAPSIAGATSLLRHPGPISVEFKGVDESIIAKWRGILSRRNDITVEGPPAPNPFAI